LVLENWHSVEEANRTDKVEYVRAKFPKRVKKRRKIQSEVKNAAEEEVGGWEEYFDYIFPEDEAASGAGRNLKLLQMAQKWK